MTEFRENVLPEVEVKDSPAAISAVEGFVRESRRLSDEYHQKKCDGEISTHEQVVFGNAATRKIVLDQVVAPVWGEYPSSAILEGHNILSDGQDLQIARTVVLGHNALSSAVNPSIEGSLVWGHNTLDGPSMSMLVHEHSRDPRAKLRAMLHAVETMDQQPETSEDMKELEALREEALSRVDQLIGDNTKKWYRNWSKNVRPDIGRDYVSYGQYAAAAHEVDNFRRQLGAFGDTYNPTVKNSIIIGHNALSSVVLGSIEDSVVGGHNALDETLGTRIRNTHVVHYKNGTYRTEYIKDNQSELTYSDIALGELLQRVSTRLRQELSRSRMHIESNDDAALSALSGAVFSKKAKVILPSGREMDGDEAQAITSAYASDDRGSFAARTRGLFGRRTKRV